MELEDVAEQGLAARRAASGAMATSSEASCMIQEEVSVAIAWTDVLELSDAPAGIKFEPSSTFSSSSVPF
jgi:hypothetical protein